MTFPVIIIFKSSASIDSVQDFLFLVIVPLTEFSLDIPTIRFDSKQHINEETFNILLQKSHTHQKFCLCQKLLMSKDNNDIMRHLSSEWCLHSAPSDGVMMSWFCMEFWLSWVTGL